MNLIFRRKIGPLFKQAMFVTQRQKQARLLKNSHHYSQLNKINNQSSNKYYKIVVIRILKNNNLKFNNSNQNSP